MLFTQLSHIRIPLVGSVPNLGLLLNKSLITLKGLFQFCLAFIKLRAELLDLDTQ